MSKKAWVAELIAQIVKNAPSDNAQKTADIIVGRLEEEGLLNLGYGNADVDRVVVAFTDTFGTTKVSKYDRFAAKRLVAKYGTDAVVGIVKLLKEYSDNQYAPVVNDVSQLEKKIVSVISFVRKVKGSEEVIDV